MFKSARSLRRARRSAPSSSAIRAFSATTRASSGGPPPPQLYGSGGKAGEVPTDVEQATGLERLQLLGELEGVSVFDESALDASRVGTKADPIRVLSYVTYRRLHWFPADSHDVHWFLLKKDKQARCMECGSVYALDFHGDEHADHHH
ncbi:cytochrome c oxidase subunit VB-domain-containing protein [Cyathus striatus]|nr:cytochrome c oxidase subunit VB-domain-containing protein [Cyathus striatus]